MGFGGASAEFRRALYQVGVGGDVEQFGADERREVVEVVVDEGVQFLPRHADEVRGRLHVHPLDVVDATDGVLEVRPSEEVAYRVLVARVVIHLDGVVNRDVAGLAQPLDGPSPTFVGGVQVEAPYRTDVARVLAGRDGTVVGEADSVETGRLGGTDHPSEELPVGVVRVGVKIAHQMGTVNEDDHKISCRYRENFRAVSEVGKGHSGRTEGRDRMTTHHFVRHVHPPWVPNREAERPLSERGHEEARRVALILSDERWTPSLRVRSLALDNGSSGCDGTASNSKPIDWFRERRTTDGPVESIAKTFQRATERVWSDWSSAWPNGEVESRCEATGTHSARTNARARLRREGRRRHARNPPHIDSPRVNERSDVEFWHDELNDAAHIRGGASDGRPPKAADNAPRPGLHGRAANELEHRRM